MGLIETLRTATAGSAWKSGPTGGQDPILGGDSSKPGNSARGVASRAGPCRPIKVVEL